MGKGSGRRPTFVSDEEFAANMARWQTPRPKKEPYIPPPLTYPEVPNAGEAGHAQPE